METRFNILLNLRGFLIGTLLAVFGSGVLVAQTPFTAEFRIYSILEDNQFANISISPANNAIVIDPVMALPQQMEALAFRSTDRLLYAIDSDDHQIYQIDRTNNIVSLGVPQINTSLDYRAGDISPDGRYYYLVGSTMDIDQVMFRVDLESPDLAAISIPLAGGTQIVDIAVHPFTGMIWGFDKSRDNPLSINFQTARIVGYNELMPEDDIDGVYFDPFGDLYGVGRTAFGVASALFLIDTNTGITERRSSGPEAYFRDFASSPYTIDFFNDVNPKTVFPCSEITYTFTIANASFDNFTNIDLVHELPVGFTIDNVPNNVFGGNRDNNQPDNVLRITGMTLPRGINQMEVQVSFDNLPDGEYTNQAVLTNLPQAHGTNRLSDNPVTVAIDDVTRVNVNVVEEDNLYFTRLVCLGRTITLDVSEYGNNIEWNTGSNAQFLTVSTPGVYEMVATSGCQTITVTYDVEFASCPYTVALDLSTDPDSTLPCNEVIYQYVLINDSGTTRTDLTLSDTFPPGFTFVEILSDPLDGKLDQSVDDDILKIDEIDLPVGADTIEVIVAIGNIPPGDYSNRARLKNLPSQMGTFRESDDPRTINFDDTKIRILGIEEDTTWIDLQLCEGVPLVLDASSFGNSFLWDNGSRSSTRTVERTGTFTVDIFDGCDPVFVGYRVQNGPQMEITFPDDRPVIFLGESYQFMPTIDNGADSIDIRWYADIDTTLSCLDCPDPIASPLKSSRYYIRATNGVCMDSVPVRLIIDNTRRIYVPNVFSPNFDGNNDFLTFQSPDFGIIHSVTVYDRWGTTIYHSNDVMMNDTNSGWNGFYQNDRPVPVGVYMWSAEIEFLDGLREHFFGDVTILR